MLTQPQLQEIDALEAFLLHGKSAPDALREAVIQGLPEDSAAALWGFLDRLSDNVFGTLFERHPNPLQVLDLGRAVLHPPEVEESVYVPAVQELLGVPEKGTPEVSDSDPHSRSQILDD